MTDAVVRDFWTDPVSARQARSWARSTFDLWFYGVESDEFTLIVGEMISNALGHGGGMISLYLRREGSRIVVAVSDFGHDAVGSIECDTAGEDGRGFVVIGALSEYWGVDEDPDYGNTVWAQLAVA